MLVYSTRYAPSVILPPQLLPKSKKTQRWKEVTMDRLEQVGRMQLIDNLKLKENYEIIRGKFIYRHYFEAEGMRDMLNELSKEFDMPHYLRHYDIISPVINTLSGEYQKRPDNFRVKGYDEQTTNAYLRQKTAMLQDYVQQEINAEIDQKLAEMGIDPAKDDFSSEAEAQQYQQEVARKQQAMTPPEIQQYMNMNWQDTGEIWAEHQLESDKQRFKQDELEKIEFEDMLCSDRCFRHYFLNADSYGQESWNPIYTFYSKSPDVRYIEDGDYVGRSLFFTIGDIIDRYGHKMNREDLESLQDSSNWDEQEVKRGGWNGGVSPEGVPYGSYMPHAGYPAQKLLTETFGGNPANPYEIPFMDSGDWDSYNAGLYTLNTRGYLLVTEAYWKSQKKIGKVTYFDPQTQRVTSILVDENVVLPDFIKEVDASDPEPGINTVQYTWINDIWKGVKISSRGTKLKKDLYIDIRPCEFQFVSGDELYGKKLPVCGQIFNNRNADSMSLVDMMKPHQIGHNVAMNQLYEIMQREIGRFFLMDINLLPALKDWGGKSFEKFMLIARSLGIGVVDTSPSNNKGASFNQFTDVNLDESARMLSRMKLAEFFESRALAQVGFNQQRLGEMAASETATNTQAALSQSYAQTESYFTNFSNYKRRCLEMNLMIAQYVQSRRKDVTVTYTKSDMSRAFIRMAGDKLIGKFFHIYISKSAEDARQLEIMRQFILNNNNAGLSAVDALEVIRSYSPAELKVILKRSLQQQEEKYQQEMQLKQQEVQNDRETKQAELQLDDLKNERDNETKKEVAYITTFGYAKNNEQDADGNGIPDVMEYDKLHAKVAADTQSLELNRQKHIADQQNKIADRQLKARELALKQRELQVKEDIANKQIEVAKINKTKYDN